jgi:glycosyltransferase involved in cell wall biosynthesis
MLPEDVRQAIGLVFVGDGDVRDELIRRSRDIAAGQILFPGFFQRDELAGFYAWADALVFPTHSDTWGFVVNEAIACGLPVIATDVAGCTADLVFDGVNGFVVPVANPEMLSAKMLKLFHTPELCERMARESLTRTRAYTPEIWAEGIVRAVMKCPEMNL